MGHRGGRAEGPAARRRVSGPGGSAGLRAGGGAETGCAKSGRIPYKQPGELPMGQVSTADLSPVLLGGRPKWALRAGPGVWQKRVAPKAVGYPTNGPETCPWVR